MPGDKRVDYDRIAAQYNRRFEGEGQRGTATAACKSWPAATKLNAFWR